MLKREDCVLIIVDIQEKLLPVMDNRDELVKNVAILVQGVKILGIPVINCRQYPKALGDTVPEINRCLEGIEPVDKKCFSCAGSEKFMEVLKATGAKHCIVCGIESHICVYQTVRDLEREAFHTHVPYDAVSSRTNANKMIAIERMRDEGAAIGCVEMLLFELLGTADDPAFKEISRLIR